MSRAGVFETVVGLAVIAVAGFFFFYALGLTDKSVGGGEYRVDAVFGSVNGVSTGSEVRIAGVKIGSVTANTLDPATYEATLQMTIDRNVPIPDDSVAKIASDGLLGGAFVLIEPGASEEYLEEGGKIVITRGSVDIINLAVQAFTSQSSGPNSNDSDVDPLGDF